MWKALQAKVAKALFGDAGQTATGAPVSTTSAPAPLKSPEPPPLAPDFDLAAYREFMCAETHCYRQDYIRDRVQLQGKEHFQAALQKGSVVVVFVHHGSWLLMNGALHHLCGGAPITSIASRRNLEFCTPEEKDFWLGVHKRSAESCNAPVIFYTDQNPIASVRWLKEPLHVLTVALDVREPAADKPESQFEFMGQNIYLQTGPAKLAQMTGASVVPAAIEYDPQSQMHTLTVYPAIDAQQHSLEAITQQALDCIGPHVQRAPQQQFYDLLGALQTPQKTILASQAQDV
jgi:hypothetical protein